MKSINATCFFCKVPMGIIMWNGEIEQGSTCVTHTFCPKCFSAYMPKVRIETNGLAKKYKREIPVTDECTANLTMSAEEYVEQLAMAKMAKKNAELDEKLNSLYVNCETNDKV